MKPKTEIEVNIKTDRAAYEPGDRVEVEIEASKTSIDDDEEVWVSIVVSDLSSFLKVPSFKQQPSL